MHPSPRTPSAERIGLWASGRNFYVYCDPDFKMFKDAKKYHYRAGLAVEDGAVRSGLRRIRRRMRRCPPCSPPDLNFGQCMLKHVFGSELSTRCPPKQKPRGALTQTQELVEFSESPVANEVYAVKVAEDQMGFEGPYWLAKLYSRSYQTEEEPGVRILSTSVFLRISKIKLASVGPRGADGFLSSSGRRAAHRGAPMHLSSFVLRLLAPAVLPALSLSLSSLP